MGYLNTLREIEESVSSSTIPANHKLILVGLINKEKAITAASADAFMHFYKDVLQKDDIFNYSSVLDEYEQAKGYANSCIQIFHTFQSIEANQSLSPWLHSALKFVDCILIHYIQVVLQEDPVSQEGLGAERSRYSQINRKGSRVQAAGRIMDHLYKMRSKMEHVTKSDKKNPGKKLLVPPKYDKIKRKILETFPGALDSFNLAYKESYPG